MLAVLSCSPPVRLLARQRVAGVVSRVRVSCVPFLSRTPSGSCTRTAVSSWSGHEFRVVALTPDAGATDLDELDATGKVALCVGAERAGLTDAVLAEATIRARIPMRAGVDSLNVAAATAIACYALRPMPSATG